VEAQTGHVRLEDGPKELAMSLCLYSKGTWFHRLKADPDIYIHLQPHVIILAYVDDLMVFGILENIQNILNMVKEHLLIKHTGSLDDEGSSIKLLGRILTRKSDSIQISEDKQYYIDILKVFGLENCKEVNTPSPGQVIWSTDHEDAVDPALHTQYRRTIDKLQWIIPTCPDGAFTVQELARSRNVPGQIDLRRLKHFLRYIKGTMHFVLGLHPNITFQPDVKHHFDIFVYVDANWAGCLVTRKSTSGVLTTI